MLKSVIILFKTLFISNKYFYIVFIFKLSIVNNAIVFAEIFLLLNLSILELSKGYYFKNSYKKKFICYIKMSNLVNIILFYFFSFYLCTEIYLSLSKYTVCVFCILL